MERNSIKIAVSLVSLIVLMVVGYFIYITATRQGLVAVDVVAAPNDANITLNGVKVASGATYIKAGVYDVKATKEGFADFSSTVSIKDGVSDQSIPILLTALSDSAKKWATENQEEYAKVEAEASETAQASGAVFREKNPIVKQLPFNNLIYTIGYRSDPADPSGNSIILEIDAPDGYRQAAIYQIQQWGFNPADYKINFKNYQNPFTS